VSGWAAVVTADFKAATGGLFPERILESQKVIAALPTFHLACIQLSMDHGT